MPLIKVRGLRFTELICRPPTFAVFAKITEDFKLIMSPFSQIDYLFNVEAAPVDKLLRPEVHVLNDKLDLVAARRERHSEDDPLTGARHQVPATV